MYLPQTYNKSLIQSGTLSMCDMIKNCMSAFRQNLSFPKNRNFLQEFLLGEFCLNPDIVFGSSNSVLSCQASNNKSH